MLDLLLNLTNDGGDLIKNGRDLATTGSFENMPLLALFGGNVKESTPVTRPLNQQAFDWWGNNLFFTGKPQIQFNSQTERVLHTVVLNSAGRQQIQQAVEADLAFMRAFATIDVQVSIVGINRVKIGIGLRRPDSLDSQEFIFIWDIAAQSFLNASLRPPNPPALPEFLEYELQHPL